MTRRPSTAPDRWEVVRHIADGQTPSFGSKHNSAERAATAYTDAVARGFYAVDVLFLPHGRAVDFEPLYGIANGFYWHQHAGSAVYAEEGLNEQ